MLETNQVLEHLVLNGCDLGDDGLEPIANGQNLIIESTTIELCYFLISAALCHNRTLVSLELGSNGLSDKSACLLGDCLKFNFKLEGLSLWQNEIGPLGAQSIASGLQANKSLLWLGLGSNQVGVEGAWALSEALQTNSSLLWLGLGGNEIGDRGAMHLSGLLQGQLLAYSITKTWHWGALQFLA